MSLGHYVYRLVDPRTAETFYVGKGVGSRIFSHLREAERAGALDVASDKLDRIRDIRAAGMDVICIVHRHGLDEATAFEVEAALIDAYPGCANLVGGLGSDRRGVARIEQLEAMYTCEEFVPNHSLVAIWVNETVAERGIYDAVRFCWFLDPRRATRCEYVVAIVRGVVRGVYVAERWLPATRENFPEFAQDVPGRYGFVGSAAPKDVEALYLGKRLPASLRLKGAANPIRYLRASEGVA